MIDTKKLFDYDISLMSEKVKLIAGMDEVGRGPLAGPVVVACVIMPYDEMIDGVFAAKRLRKRIENVCTMKSKRKPSLYLFGKKSKTL